jgi:hypothetical protein
MAQRRMFHKELVSSDKFLDMPTSSQALFFHLGINADDEGFVSSPNRIQRSVGASPDDLKILLGKGFIQGFESGVIVILDWAKHNQLRKDRFTPTIHQEEKQQLQVIEYQAPQPNGNQMATNGKPSIVKVSSVKSSLDKSKKDIRHKYGEYKNVLLTDKQYEKLSKDFPNLKDLITLVDEGIQMKGYKYKDFNLAIRKWAKNNYGSNNAPQSPQNRRQAKLDNQFQEPQPNYEEMML